MNATSRIFLLLLSMLFVATPLLAEDGEEAPRPDSFGTALSEAETIPISKLYATPDDFVGKTVKVEGRVIAVCAKRGCWMELAGDAEFESMRIKVDDGVIVFPMDAVGKIAVAEGTFTRIELTLEQTQMMEKHKCEEKGEEFDPAKVCTPATLYQIAGLGAVIR